MRYPHDWKNPTGYLVAISIQYALGFYPLQYIGSFMCLGFGSFMFSHLFNRILKDELNAINEMTNDKRSRKNMSKKFSEFIRKHGAAQQLSR